MFKRLILCSLAVLFLLLVPAFAGPFSGVGGDADYFPKDRFIGSVYVIPVYLEGASSVPIIGVEGVIGSTDLSLSGKYGLQASFTFGGVGLRKKILDEANMPFSCALLIDVESITTGTNSINGSYLGAIFSKKMDKLSPYFALLSTTYYTRTDAGVGPITYQYIHGNGLAGGARYDFDDNWSIRGEANYNALNTSVAVPWPKSILSFAMYASFRR